MQLNEKLIKSCKNGNLEEVKALVKQGVDIHANNNHALFWSSIKGHLKVVKYLVENGADIHTDNDGVLRWSAFNGHLNIVKYLIEQGANIHASNNEALRLAAEDSYLEVVNYLFSLYENKEVAFKILLEDLSQKNNLSIIKDIIDNYNLNFDTDFLEEIKNIHPSIYDYLNLSKEIKLTQNSINFDIGQ